MYLRESAEGRSCWSLYVSMLCVCIKSLQCSVDHTKKWRGIGIIPYLVSRCIHRFENIHFAVNNYSYHSKKKMKCKPSASTELFTASAYIPLHSDRRNVEEWKQGPSGCTSLMV